MGALCPPRKASPVIPDLDRAFRVFALGFCCHPGLDPGSSVFGFSAAYGGERHWLHACAGMTEKDKDKTTTLDSCVRRNDSKGRRE